MSGSHSTTVLEHSSETVFIEVSDPLYLILLDAQRSLGFASMCDLIRDMLTSSKVSSWLEYPELLPVCESSGMKYGALLEYISNN